MILVALLLPIALAKSMREIIPDRVCKYLSDLSLIGDWTGETWSLPRQPVYSLALSEYVFRKTRHSTEFCSIDILWSAIASSSGKEHTYNAS